MCGIAGQLRFDGQSVSQETLQAMTDALAHRGPDGEGFHFEKNVGLGHRRLSIIDLDGGKQPISNEDSTIWVTYNGEIYNYRNLRDRLIGLGHQFRTHCDTEVIVHAYEQWGTDCLQHFRGMFAFALWDQNKQQMMLARDRVGIKPLLYAESDYGISFASEMQALLVDPELNVSLNPAAIDLYLHYQYIPAPETIYHEVKKLPPAHFVMIDRNGKVGTPKRYWKVEFSPDYSLDESAWIERLDEALQETIETHLVSDVPFGAFLSGGVDSSTILAYMSESLNNPVKTFCIGHQQDAYDERKWARQAAEICSSEYYEQTVNSDGMSLLPKLVKHYGEPFADSSALPTYYVSQLASQNVKMVLSGDGGDELFAGYHAYPAILTEHRPAKTSFLKAKHFLANRARDVGLWSRNATPADSKYRRTAVIDSNTRGKLWRSEYLDFLSKTRADFDQRYRSVAQKELLGQLQAFDVENYIPFDNLTKVDIASMSHSLEVRVPLLDHQFIETVSQIPPEMKLKISQSGKMVGKYLLKRVASRFYDDSFIHRQKKGFEVPVAHWFAGPHRDDLIDRLTNPQGHLAEWFNLSALNDIAQDAGQNKVAAWKAWSLLVLQEWFEQNLSRHGIHSY